MENKNKILVWVITSLILFSTTFAGDTVYKLKLITPENKNLLKVSFETPLPVVELNSDLKVFKDIEVKKVDKDTTDPTKLTLNLNSQVEVGKTYNIFWVFWVESSVDFTIWDSFNVKLFTKEQATGQSIVNVVIKNPKVIELYFKEALAWSEFEFKVLEDLSVSEIKLNNWQLEIKTITNLESKINYILMVISIADKSWIEYTLDESIYDFSTPDFSKVIVLTSSWAMAQVPVSPNEPNNLNSASNIPPKLSWLSWAIIPSTWSGLMALDKLGVWKWVKSSLSWSTAWTWNLVSVALKLKETPDTWAETWVLMILTLIINSFYFLTRRTALKS